MKGFVFVKKYFALGVGKAWHDAPILKHLKNKVNKTIIVKIAIA